MKEKIKKFLKILYVEIEDLKDDLQLLVDMHIDRERKGEITQYVFLENLSLIKKEIDIVKEVLEEFHGFSGTEYGNMEAVLLDLDTKIRKKVTESGCAEAVYTFLKKKIEKVKNYIENTTD